MLSASPLRRGSKPGFYHGYIHVRTDLGSMVVPIDVTVVNGGVYPEPREVDFGTLTDAAEARELVVSLINRWEATCTCSSG